MCNHQFRKIKYTIYCYIAALEDGSYVAKSHTCNSDDNAMP